MRFANLRISGPSRGSDIVFGLQNHPVRFDGTTPMPVFTTSDDTNLLYEDWGASQPVLFSHGWPLNGDTWDSQMQFLASNGFRVIALVCRSHGRSDQTWGGNHMDRYATDLAELIEYLDLSDAVLVGHSAGSGGVAHYVDKFGSSRVAKMALVSAVPPSC